jgi:hypothetical protein
VTVFLDSDTIVRGDLTELWNWAEEHEFVVPQFADWSTTRRAIVRRIAAWSELYPDQIERALQFGPAVNCGVFAFRRHTAFVRDWCERITPGRTCFIPDESGMQVLLPGYRHYVAPSRYNVSCRFGDPAAPETRVIHYHGDKHCRRGPDGQLLYGGDIWMKEFEEVRQADLCDVNSWLPGGDRMLRRALRHQPAAAPAPPAPAGEIDRSLTLVTAVSSGYVEKLRLTLPTWQRKPQLADCPLVVFYHGVEEAELEFIRKQRAQVQLIPWDLPGCESGRERMLSAFVFGAPRVVKTPYWVKLDADSFFCDAQDMFSPHMFEHDVAGHKWRYTKPGRWLVTLEDWAERTGVPGPRFFEGAEREVAQTRRRYGHGRFASWICLHRTEFTAEAAALAGSRLPVPSHDTYLWYLAQRLPHRSWCWHNFKRRGAGTHTNIEVIRERVREALLT